MKRLTPEEKSALRLKKGPISYLRSEIDSLQKGEILQIDKADCKNQRGPYYVIRRLSEATGRKFTLSTIFDKSGWVVERIS